jgi:hypothetical protein
MTSLNFSAFIRQGLGNTKISLTLTTIIVTSFMDDPMVYYLIKLVSAEAILKH